MEQIWSDLWSERSKGPKVAEKQPSGDIWYLMDVWSQDWRFLDFGSAGICNDLQRSAEICRKSLDQTGFGPSRSNVQDQMSGDQTSGDQTSRDQLSGEQTSKDQTS